MCVNDALINYLALELPMGGWKASGLGVRHGAGGIRKYTQQQAMWSRASRPSATCTCSPTTPASTKLLGRWIKLLYGRGKRG